MSCNYKRGIKSNYGHFLKLFHVSVLRWSNRSLAPHPPSLVIAIPSSIPECTTSNRINCDYECQYYHIDDCNVTPIFLHDLEHPGPSQIATKVEVRRIISSSCTIRVCTRVLRLHPFSRIHIGEVACTRRLATPRPKIQIKWISSGNMRY